MVLRRRKQFNITTLHNKLTTGSCIMLDTFNFGIWNLEFGNWALELGTWNLSGR
jgi:hypothetical protein